MTEYGVILILVSFVNFVIAILNFAKASGKDTRDLRDSNIELNQSIKHLTGDFKEITGKNKEEHEHFYHKINNHETRITILEDHEHNHR